MTIGNRPGDGGRYDAEAEPTAATDGGVNTAEDLEDSPAETREPVMMGDAGGG